jgi:GNAT superfamily N-acetyltransferase
MANDPELIIRRARPNDQDLLYPLARDLSAFLEVSRASFTKSFSNLLSDSKALVLVAANGDADQLTGYLLGFQHQSFFADGPVGWVEEVYTLPDRRRAGIAGALMAEFERWAWESGARLVALATRRAQDFYRAIGYEESAAYFRKLAPG